MKFSNYQEMYDMLQACHGDYKKAFAVAQELVDLSWKGTDADSAKTFGEWGMDHYQCGDNLFCLEVSHSNNVTCKEHVFKFYDDDSDTVEDDKIYGSEDEAFEASIDYDFLNVASTHIK